MANHDSVKCIHKNCDRSYYATAEQSLTLLSPSATVRPSGITSTTRQPAGPRDVLSRRDVIRCGISQRVSRITSLSRPFSRRARGVQPSSFLLRLFLLPAALHDTLPGLYRLKLGLCTRYPKSSEHGPGEHYCTFAKKQRMIGR